MTQIHSGDASPESLCRSHAYAKAQWINSSPPGEEDSVCIPQTEDLQIGAHVVITTLH